MGTCTLHRQFEDEGGWGWKVPGKSGSLPVEDYGGKEELLLLKVKGRVAWRQRTAWAQCASAGRLLLSSPVAPGPRDQQAPLEVSRPSPHLRSAEWPWGGGAIYLILTGCRAPPPRDGTGSTPGLTPPQQAPELAAAGPGSLPG